MAVNDTTKPTVPNVGWGPASWLGVFFTIVPLVGSIVGFIENNDTAGVAGAGASLLVALATIGGRMAQAVAAARSVATIAGPWIDAIQEALAATPPSSGPQTVVVSAAPTLSDPQQVAKAVEFATGGTVEEEGLTDDEVEALGDSDLPTDEEEFASPPDDGEPVETAVKPDTPAS